MGPGCRLVGGVLPFKLVVGKTDDSLTSSSGALAFVEAWRAAGLDEAGAEIGAKKRNRGPSDADWLLGAVLTIAAGGKSVEDIEHLKKDQGLLRVLPFLAALSPRYLLEFLRRFHDDKLVLAAVRAVGCGRCKAALEKVASEVPFSIERVRELFEQQDHGHAFIPEETAPLRALDQVLNRRLIASVQSVHPQETATLDLDGSIHGSRKRQAFRTYEGERGYQPVVVVWAEQRLLVADQFRDGNVPASMGNLEVFQRARANVPAGVKRILFRADSGAYDHALLRYLDGWREGGKRKDDERVPFAVSARVSRQLRDEIRALPESAWRKVVKDGKPTDREVAEVAYVPSEERELKGMRPFRYVAIRIPRRQYELFDHGDGDAAPAGDERYLYFAVVTNIPEAEKDAAALINWHREKCGTIEYEHDVLKNDLAAATFPSKDFGANAAWYRLNAITRNLFTLVSLGLPTDYRNARPHTLRQALVRVAGRIVSTGRRLVLWLGVAGLDTAFAELRAFLERLHGT